MIDNSHLEVDDLVLMYQSLARHLFRCLLLCMKQNGASCLPGGLWKGHGRVTWWSKPFVQDKLLILD